MGKSVEVENLTFKYGENTILNSLDFKIIKGTFLTIIGPNGSGKSTLLKTIAANLLPKEGIVKIDERELTTYRTKELAKDLAVVPQNTLIEYGFSVYDIVMMGRNPHLKRFQKESPKDLQVVKEAMEWTNTWKLRDRPINVISGGERQRVIIAKALAQDPKVILLDEPISSLDIHHQIEMMDLLKELNEKKKVTIIAVLHDINLAARYSEEIILLHEGKVICMGKPEEVIRVDVLQKVYEMEMTIDRNEYTGTLQVIPISSQKRRKNQEGKQIHIICGGGTGKMAIQKLFDEGFLITLGVVNIGDSDWEAGKRLGLTMAVEIPYSEITEGAIKKARELMDQADVLLLMSIPIGRGNIMNLELVEEALKKGKKVFFHDYYREGEVYDFTFGKGQKKLKELKRAGMITIRSVSEMKEKIMEWENE